MTLVLALWALAVAGFLGGLRALHLYHTGLAFGDMPGWELCPICGGDGGLVKRGTRLMRLGQSRSTPTIGPRHRDRAYRKQVRSHMANTPVWDCRRCDNRGWVARP